MAHELDLYHEDYLKIVNDCLHESTPLGLKELIESRYEMYIKCNKNFLSKLLDVIDNTEGFSENYVKLGSSRTILKKFDEIISFEDFDTSFKYPQLIYAVCLVFEMCNYERKNFRTLQAKETSEVTTATPPQKKTTEPKLTTVSKTFNSSLTVKQLEEIYQWLVRKKYIAGCSFTQFKYVFSQEAISKAKKNKIKWIKEYNKKSDNASLFILLMHIGGAEFSVKNKEDLFIKSIFFKKICNCFSKNNGEPLKEVTIKTSFDKWKKRHPDYGVNNKSSEDKIELCQFLKDVIESS